MQSAHVLNIDDSFHTMLGMESLKRSGTITPAVSPRSSFARRQPPQQFAIDGRQVSTSAKATVDQQRCQQQSRQQ